MGQWVAYRTLIATLAGLVFLLILAALAGLLDLDSSMVEALAYAGTGMIAALAGKSAIEHGMQAKHPRKEPGS